MRCQVKFSRCVLAAIISVLCLANAKAIPITYTETATISGSLNGVSFANELLTLTGTGDTAAVAPASSTGFTGFTNPVTATFSVAGTGSGSLTGPYHVFDNHIAESAGFTNETIPGSLLFIFGPAAFGSYALSTSIGPFTDDAMWNPGVSFPSTAGALIINFVIMKRERSRLLLARFPRSSHSPPLCHSSSPVSACWVCSAGAGSGKRKQPPDQNRDRIWERHTGTATMMVTVQ